MLRESTAQSTNAMTRLPSSKPKVSVHVFVFCTIATKLCPKTYDLELCVRAVAYKTSQVMLDGVFELTSTAKATSFISISEGLSLNPHGVDHESV